MNRGAACGSNRRPLGLGTVHRRKAFGATGRAPYRPCLLACRYKKLHAWRSRTTASCAQESGAGVAHSAAQCLVAPALEATSASATAQPHEGTEATVGPRQAPNERNRRTVGMGARSPSRAHAGMCCNGAVRPNQRQQWMATGFVACSSFRGIFFCSRRLQMDANLPPVPYGALTPLASRSTYSLKSQEYLRRDQNPWPSWHV